MEGWVSKDERGEYGMKNVSVQDGGLFMHSCALCAGTQGRGKRRKLSLFWFHYHYLVSDISQY